LNLIASGDVVASPKCGIAYRVHSGQESALAPTRRKFLEAEIWISNFLITDVFQQFICKLKPAEVTSFWKSTREFSPIYQTSSFGYRVLNTVGAQIIRCHQNLDIREKIVGDLALLSGVLIKPGEFGAFDNALSKSRASNFEFLIQPGSCSKILELAPETNSTTGDLEKFNQFRIGCKHAIKGEFFPIPCYPESMNTVLMADLVINLITENLESQGILDFSISPNERQIIGVLRKFKSAMPIFIVRFIKKFVSLTGVQK
jgi:hypothetical protein